jgi:alkaline phosphatase
MLLVLALAGLSLAQDATPPADAPPAAPQRPSVILFIGDGMGPSQVTLGRIVKDAPLYMDSITTTALVLNESLGGQVTDSAAAATALASGFKTKNHFIGMDVEGRPLKLITEELSAAGYRIGIVTTTRVTHATPAGFYAHVPTRAEEPAIANQLAQKLISGQINVCMGGGAKYFPVERREELVARGLTLLGEDHLAPAIDGTGAATLATMTARALAALAGDGTKPFFLMVEGGRIDHACHGHDAAAAAREVIAFDDAVNVGLEAVARSPRLLVVVTADHATGGLALSEVTDRPGLRRVKAAAITMLARAEKDPERLRVIVRELAGLELTEEEAKLALAKEYKYAHGGALAHLLSAKLGVHFAWPLDVQDGYHSTEGHDATMVPLYAAGFGAERFGGTMDNTDIPKRIRELTLGDRRP